MEQEKKSGWTPYTRYVLFVFLVVYTFNFN